VYGRDVCDVRQTSIRPGHPSPCPPPPWINPLPVSTNPTLTCTSSTTDPVSCAPTHSPTDLMTSGQTMDGWVTGIAKIDHVIGSKSAVVIYDSTCCIQLNYVHGIIIQYYHGYVCTWLSDKVEVIRTVHNNKFHLNRRVVFK
jgi:hypothetical protein